MYRRKGRWINAGLLRKLEGKKSSGERGKMKRMTRGVRIKSEGQHNQITGQSMKQTVKQLTINTP